MIKQCPYCNLDTGGNHEWGCPNKKSWGSSFTKSPGPSFYDQEIKRLKAERDEALKQRDRLFPLIFKCGCIVRDEGHDQFMLALCPTHEHEEELFQLIIEQRDEARRVARRLLNDEDYRERCWDKQYGLAYMSIDTTT